MSNGGDPFEILMGTGLPVAEERQGGRMPVQTDFVKDIKSIVTQAIEAARLYKQTKVFTNLCDQKILAEWNELQKDEMVQIFDVHNIPAPKSAVLIDAIRVDYVRVDEDIFHMALIREMSIAGYFLPDYLPVIRPGKLREVLEKLNDLGQEAQVAFSSAIIKKFKYANIRKQTPEEFISIADRIITSDLYNNIVENGGKPEKGGVDVKKKRRSS